MAGPIGVRRRSRAGWAVLCVLGLALSCSGTSSAPRIESTSEEDSPTGLPAPTETYYRVESEAAWSVGVDPAPEAPDERLLYLVPTSPRDGLDTHAEFTRTNVGGVPEYSVIVSWPLGSARMSAMPAISCDHLPYDGNWRPVRVRGVAGCEFTNEFGKYFLKWMEDGTFFHYNAFAPVGVEARQMLADWDPLE